MMEELLLSLSLGIRNTISFIVNIIQTRKPLRGFVSFYNTLVHCTGSETSQATHVISDDLLASVKKIPNSLAPLINVDYFFRPKHTQHDLIKSKVNNPY